MPTAWALFLHAIRMVFRDIPGILRATWPGLVMLCLGSVGVLWTAATSDVDTSTFPIARHINWPAVAMILLCYILGSVITAIFWHRCVLIDRPDAPAPSFSAGMVLRYIWLGLIVTLLALLFLVPAMMGLFALTTASGPMARLTHILRILLNWLGVYLAYRFTLGLPGRCVGHSISMTESFGLTKHWLCHSFGWPPFRAFWPPLSPGQNRAFPYLPHSAFYLAPVCTSFRP